MKNNRRAHRIAHAALEIVRIEETYTETGTSVGATAAGRELEAAVSDYLDHHMSGNGHIPSTRRVKELLLS